MSKINCQSIDLIVCRGFSCSAILPSAFFLFVLISVSVYKNFPCIRLSYFIHFVKEELLYMRLNEKEITAIKKAVQKNFGKDTSVYLFGSRTDDAKRGGDILL